MPTKCEILEETMEPLFSCPFCGTPFKHWLILAIVFWMEPPPRDFA